MSIDMEEGPGQNEIRLVKIKFEGAKARVENKPAVSQYDAGSAEDTYWKAGYFSSNNPGQANEELKKE